MPRQRNAIPKYQHHKQSGQARVRLVDQGGARRDVYLGAFNSPKSKTEYARVIAEWQAAGGNFTPAAAAHMSVDGLISRFLEHARQHYRRPDGRMTSEVAVYSRAVGELRFLYGSQPAREFGPLALKAVRQRMIANDVSRKVINQFVGKIRSIFKWAASEELVPVTVHQALCTVTGLQRGRTEARETEPIRPIADEFVDATLTHVSEMVRGMIELQRLTGMRPMEICLLRPCDLEISENVWLYRPSQHKSAWRGRNRIIAVGPQAQEVVKRFMTPELTMPMFSPRRERAMRDERLRALAKCPSPYCRKKSQPAQAPKDAYTKDSYARAIARGVQAANNARAAVAAQRGRELQPHETIPHWHPNQLRHAHATLVRRRYGLEAAQVALGHANADVTQIYAEANINEAIRIAREIG